MLDTVSTFYKMYHIAQKVYVFVYNIISTVSLIVIILFLSKGQHAYIIHINSAINGKHLVLLNLLFAYTHTHARTHAHIHKDIKPFFCINIK